MYLTGTCVEHYLVNTEVGTFCVPGVVVYLYGEIRIVGDIKVLGGIAVAIYLIPLIVFITAVALVHGVQHTGQERHYKGLLAKLILRKHTRHQLGTGLSAFGNISYGGCEVHL